MVEFYVGEKVGIYNAGFQGCSEGKTIETIGQEDLGLGEEDFIGTIEAL